MGIVLICILGLSWSKLSRFFLMDTRDSYQRRSKRDEESSRADDVVKNEYFEVEKADVVARLRRAKKNSILQRNYGQQMMAMDGDQVTVEVLETIVFPPGRDNFFCCLIDFTIKNDYTVESRFGTNNDLFGVAVGDIIPLQSFDYTYIIWGTLRRATVKSLKRKASVSPFLIDSLKECQGSNQMESCLSQILVSRQPTQALVEFCFLKSSESCTQLVKALGQRLPIVNVKIGSLLTELAFMSDGASSEGVLYWKNKDRVETALERLIEHRRQSHVIRILQQSAGFEFEQLIAILKSSPDLQTWLSWPPKTKAQIPNSVQKQIWAGAAATTD